MDTLSRLPEFAANHWDLFAALALVLLMLYGGPVLRRIRGYHEATVPQGVQIINRDAVVIDVRDDSEVKQGMIADARHLPLGSLDGRIKELDSARNKPLLVVCRSGHRSAIACGKLRKHGFAEVYNLKGGMLAWLNAGLPVIKPGKSKKK
jgi:rhodanese-related sulfurtransferase